MKTTATTTKINYHRIINQLYQKFPLTAAEKKQVANFIGQRMTDDSKLESSTLVPAEAEYVEIQHEDMSMTLAHSSNNLDIFYVIIRDKNQRKETEEVEVNKPLLSNEDAYKIIMGTIRRLQDLLETYKHVSLDDWVTTQLYNFLVVQPIKGRIAVVCSPELPKSEGYSLTQIRVGDYNLDLMYGENPTKNNFAHVLWVKLVMSEDAKKREYSKRREERFRTLWNKSQLPNVLLDEVMKNIDLTATVTVVAFAKAHDWVGRMKAEKTELMFIGQKPDKKTGNFVPNRPIGYIKGNVVVITAPGYSSLYVSYNF